VCRRARQHSVRQIPAPVVISVERVDPMSGMAAIEAAFFRLNHPEQGE